MAVATFDTLKFAKTLKAAGVPDKQAEAIGEALAVNFEGLATKEDLVSEIRDAERRLNIKIGDAKQNPTVKRDAPFERFDWGMLLLQWLTYIAIFLFIMGLPLRPLGHAP